MQKYKGIYDLIRNADLDRICDRSNWFHKNQDYIDRQQPLWIIIESKILNKRMWITESLGDLEIATAQLDLKVDSAEYHKSYERYSFKNQRDLCTKLKEILEPCFEKENSKEMELEM